MATLYAVIGMLAGLVTCFFLTARYMEEIDKALEWCFKLARKGKKV